MTKVPIIDREFQGLLPPLLEDEYSQLKANILSAGKCREAIGIWNGLIVDGFNRFCICVENGIEFKMEEHAFATRNEAKLWIINNQMGRRNLTDAARIELALARAEILKEKARKKSKMAKVDEPAETAAGKGIREVVANEAGISTATLHNYLHVRRFAPPKLLRKVKSGKIKISAAYKMLTPQVIKELCTIFKTYARAAEFAADLNHDETINKHLKKLKARLIKLCEIYKPAKELKK